MKIAFSDGPHFQRPNGTRQWQLLKKVKNFRSMETTMTITMTMSMASLKPKHMRPKIPQLPYSLNSTRIVKSLCLPVGAPTLVDQFDPTIPIERAVTPPSSWYTDPSFYALELDSVFYRGWQAVGQLLFTSHVDLSNDYIHQSIYKVLNCFRFSGYTEQIKNPGDFFTGRYALSYGSF